MRINPIYPDGLPEIQDNHAGLSQDRYYRQQLLALVAIIKCVRRRFRRVCFTGFALVSLALAFVSLLFAAASLFSRWFLIFWLLSRSLPMLFVICCRLCAVIRIRLRRFCGLREFPAAVAEEAALLALDDAFVLMISLPLLRPPHPGLRWQLRRFRGRGGCRSGCRFL